ncbi:hypothetical protein PoB_002743700 [Plakobranchus ocellatus]|uniref:Uncharacterized protein n=1 Tax=Plakobranchus ocellatus TaxID=259542 RepID=A0AAV4A210_9GAST|nr:hypothetical protein PoB_002743700 [Plakobranchus ocellatus]
MHTEQKEADTFNKHFSKVNTGPRDPVADPRMPRLRRALERRPIASNRTFEVEFTATELDIAQRRTSQARRLVWTGPQQGDLRLSGPPSGQGAGIGARTRDRRVPADLRADSQATVLPTPPLLFDQ